MAILVFVEASRPRKQISWAWLISCSLHNSAMDLPFIPSKTMTTQFL